MEQGPFKLENALASWREELRAQGISPEVIEELESHLSGEGESWAVANARRLEELSPELQSRLQIVATTRASRRDVALVTTRAQ